MKSLTHQPQRRSPRGPCPARKAALGQVEKLSKSAQPAPPSPYLMKARRKPQESSPQPKCVPSPSLSTRRRSMEKFCLWISIMSPPLLWPPLYPTMRLRVPRGKESRSNACESLRRRHLGLVWKRNASNRRLRSLSNWTMRESCHPKPRRPKPSWWWRAKTSPKERISLSWVSATLQYPLQTKHWKLKTNWVRQTRLLQRACPPTVFVSLAVEARVWWRWANQGTRTRKNSSVPTAVAAAAAAQSLREKRSEWPRRKRSPNKTRPAPTARGHQVPPLPAHPQAVPHPQLVLTPPPPPHRPPPPVMKNPPVAQMKKRLLFLNHLQLQSMYHLKRRKTRMPSQKRGLLQTSRSSRSSRRLPHSSRSPRDSKRWSRESVAPKDERESTSQLQRSWQKDRGYPLSRTGPRSLLSFMLDSCGSGLESLLR